MTINLQRPDLTELKPRITVFGVGGGGCNAVNNMIQTGLEGVEFVVANTDSQALASSKADRLIQMGVAVTQGLGAGAQPEIGRAAAEETMDEIVDHLQGTNMAFITAGMGGGTGTGAAPVVARAAREAGILTVGVVTKPFQFEGRRRQALAQQGIDELQRNVDTLIVIPNQNLFRIANEKTTFADAFAMADEVLYSGVACITDLMVKDGLINLDFADVRSVMREMGKAMMGTGEASGDQRAVQAAEAAISNPLLDDVSMRGAKGLLISVTGGRDMTLFEVDEAAGRIREEVDETANIIFGATFDEGLEGMIRVSVVATGIDDEVGEATDDVNGPSAEMTHRLKAIDPAPASHDTAPVVAAFAEAMKPEAGRPEADGGAPVTSLDVEIAPIVREPGRSGVDEEPRTQAAGPFTPQAAEKPSLGGPIMPSIEDFPPHAQRQMRADAPHGEPRQRGLLARLAGGFGGRREDEEHASEPRERHVQPGGRGEEQHAEAKPLIPMTTPEPRRTGEPAAPSGQLDQRGRAPASASKPQINLDEDLEIPAFLRRQTG